MNKHSKNASRGRPRGVADGDIVEAALEIVMADGPDALTFSRVGTAVGLAPASLAHRFGNRCELVREVSRAITAEMLRRCEKVVDEGSLSLPVFLASLTPEGATPKGVLHQFAFLQIELKDAQLREEVRHRSQAILNAIALYLTVDLKNLNLDPLELHRISKLIEQQLIGLQLCWSMEPDGPLRSKIETDISRIIDGLKGKVT